MVFHFGRIWRSFNSCFSFSLYFISCAKIVWEMKYKGRKFSRMWNTASLFKQQQERLQEKKERKKKVSWMDFFHLFSHRGSSYLYQRTNIIIHQLWVWGETFKHFLILHWSKYVNSTKRTNLTDKVEILSWGAMLLQIPKQKQQQ